MRNSEFDIARELIMSHEALDTDQAYPTPLLRPVRFREIDGRELARQYVAHRQLLKAEELARKSAAARPILNDTVPGDEAPRLSPAPPSGGWMSQWRLRLLAPFRRGGPTY